MSEAGFDYVIIGGGSAGAVLASRLTEDPRLRVCLLEAGSDISDRDEPREIRDVYYSAFFRPDWFWPDLRGQFLGSSQHPEAPDKFYHQARLLGGGSSVNAMIALRGLRGDYEEWVQAGAAGWGWSDVLPFFRKLETDTDFQGEAHGTSGPISIRRHRRDDWPGFTRAIEKSLERQGWEYVDDMNASDRNGFCRVPMSSTTERRCSTATTYLGEEVRRRPNLTIRCDAFVSKILLQGKRAVGVRIKQGDETRSITAREVIVSAGTIHSPALLQNAGIGPADVLAKAGIELMAELPGVGANLQDHPMVSIAAHLKPEGRQPSHQRAASNMALRYDSLVDGCSTSDMYVSVTNKAAWHALGATLATLIICVYKPYSRGRVAVLGPDANVEPAVHFNILSDGRDIERLARAVRFSYDTLASPEVQSVTNSIFPASYSERIRKINTLSRTNHWQAIAAKWIMECPAPIRKAFTRRFIHSGDSLSQLVESDDRLNYWICQNAQPFLHAVGTCRMGDRNDPGAVVDSSGRVLGVSGLRVVDASIMPTIPRANTNLITIMLAEKIAAKMMGSISTSRE